MSERACACGCGDPLEGRRSNVRYASAACSSRAWKERAGYVLQGKRKPYQTRFRSGIQLPYFKTLAALKDRPGEDPETILRSVLSDRQRAQLDQRSTT